MSLRVDYVLCRKKRGVYAGSISILLFLKFPTNKCSLLDRKSNIAKSQFLKIWFFDHFWANYNYGNAKTSIRGCTSAQIKTLRPYFSIFSITVVRICLRKQQSKFFTNMLTTPSIEHVNIWFDSASPCLSLKFDRNLEKIFWHLFLQVLPNFGGS